MPEIIRSGQGSETSNQEGIKFSDFQEANPMESSPFHMDQNVLGEVNAINTASEFHSESSDPLQLSHSSPTLLSPHK